MLKAIIRFKGFVGTNKKIEETLSRIRLRKKNVCVVLNETPELKGILEKINNFAAYGEIKEETLAKLIKERGKVIGKSKAKIENPEKAAKEMIAGKKPEEIGIKPFFRLHPARGGIKSKLHYPKGVLGNHKENINKLIERML